MMSLKCLEIGMFLLSSWEVLVVKTPRIRADMSFLVRLSKVLLVAQCNKGALSQVYLLGLQNKEKLMETEKIKRSVN